MPTSPERAPGDAVGQDLSELFERAAARRGRVRLLYGSAAYVVDVLACRAGVVTGASDDHGVLRFRLERVTEAVELPSSDPLF